MVRLLIIVLLSVLGIIIFKAVKEIANAYAKQVELNEYELVLSTKYSTEQLAVLDKMILEAIDKYKILNIEYRDVVYITDKIQEDMIRTVLSNVLKGMSPLLKKKLYYIYGEEYLEDTILEKIQLQVLDYTTSVNSNLQ